MEHLLTLQYQQQHVLLGFYNLFVLQNLKSSSIKTHVYARPGRDIQCSTLTVLLKHSYAHWFIHINVTGYNSGSQPS